MSPRDASNTSDDITLTATNMLPEEQSNGYHHKQQNGTVRTETSRRTTSFASIMNKFIVIIAIIVALILGTGNLSNIQDKNRRLYNTIRGLYKLARISPEDWNLYYDSLDVMAKANLETKQDELAVASWYKVLNLFCDLGELEKMYLPPVVDPDSGLFDNQILVENKMALGAASEVYNNTYINKVGETLPDKYKARYVVHVNNPNDKQILPLISNNVVPKEDYIQRPMDILDLGCGKGRIANEMMVYTNGKATGLNIDASQLKNAMNFALRKDLFPDKLNFLHGSFNDPLPFPNESFDFVYEVGAFTYMINKKSVFQEIYRVLRPGGSFAYQDWTNIGYDATDKEQFDKVLIVKKISGLIELHDPEELASIAKEVGFDVIFNDDGGYESKVSSQLLGNMQGSFWFVDGLMDFLISTKILPPYLIKAWRTMRPSEARTIKETVDRRWLNMGHVLLIRKPLD